SFDSRLSASAGKGSAMDYIGVDGFAASTASACRPPPLGVAGASVSCLIACSWVAAFDTVSFRSAGAGLGAGTAGTCAGVGAATRLRVSSRVAGGGGVAAVGSVSAGGGGGAGVGAVSIVDEGV